MSPSWWLDRTRGVRAAVVLREDRDILMAVAALELVLEDSPAEGLGLRGESGRTAG